MNRRILTRLALALVLLAGALVAGTSPAGASAAGARTARSASWISRVNTVRTDAGEKTVRANASWVAGIKAHLNYLRRTPAKYLTGQYANAHSENPDSPYYTAAGAREGESSDLAFGTASDAAAIDAWLAAPFHAIGMLRPALTSVAFYRDPKSGDAGLDVIRGITGSTPTTAVFYPRRSTTLSRFGGEVPDPVETCRHRFPHAGWSNAGLPLVALLPGLSSQKGLRATVTQPNGTKLSSTTSGLCLVDASTFYSTDSVYGPTGREILQSDHAVLLIPRTPLRRGRYSVRLQFGSTYHGHVPSWTFTSTPS